MKIKGKHNSNRFAEFKNIILQHINMNMKDYLILSIIFIIGVMIGVVIINNSNEQSKNEISGYINGFIATINEEEYKVDKIKLVKTSIIENIKLVAIIWIAGSTIIGIPLIYIITLCKGFCIGYTISAIIATMGAGKRNVVFMCMFIATKCNNNSSNFNVMCKCT